MIKNDPSNGYEAIALDFMQRRELSAIGVDRVRYWARLLPQHAVVLDLGCGSGRPVSATLASEGCLLYCIDASDRLAAACRRNLPQAEVACEAVEYSNFFGRNFDAVIAVGLLFLLTPDKQRQLIAKVAAVLNPGGRFLFTAPRQVCQWTDVLTGHDSCSLGVNEYQQLFLQIGLSLVAEYQDEGGNHYYDTMLASGKSA
jgi:SAM-dependent methyltransferase